MKTRLLLILFLGIVLWSCQKRKYPVDEIQQGNERIFSNGVVDNEPFALKIGENGYYCYSSYEQRVDSVYMFEGTLKKFDCNPCPVSLGVELSDYKKRSPGAGISVDSAFKTGSRNFIPALPRPFTVRFQSDANKTVIARQWDLGNGETSQAAFVDCEFTQPGARTISLKVGTLGNCESMVIRKVFASAESGLFACQITTTAVQGTTYTFDAGVTGGKPPYTYKWDFGDGNTNTSASPSNKFVYVGSYPVKVQVIDSEDHICEYTFIHVAGNDLSSCSAWMTSTLKGVREALLKGVRMQWTDKSNSIFRSDMVEQPAGSYFEVIKSEDYPANENGETGRLLTVKFNLLVSDGGRNVWLKSDNTAIVVTYK